MTPSQRDTIGGLSVLLLLLGILMVAGPGWALVAAGGVGLAVAVMLTLQADDVA